MTWNAISCRTWIGLLLVSFSLSALGQSAGELATKVAKALHVGDTLLADSLLSTTTFPTDSDSLEEMMLLMAEVSLRRGDSEAAIHRCTNLGRMDDAKQEIRRQRAMGHANFLLRKWESAETHFLACTANPFARAMIRDAIGEARDLRPVHLRGAMTVSKWIPGVAYLYAGDRGKALGNFALLGVIGVGFAIYWPVAASLTVFVAMDWVTQGMARGQQVLLDAVEGKRARLLLQIMSLSRE